MTSSCTTGYSRITEATYGVEIRERGTGDLVCELEDGEGNFARTMDAASTAEWSVPAGDDCTACDCPVEERKHELAFIRDDWEEPAWIGPILRTVDDDAQGTIRYNAVDRLYWWEGAPASRDVLYQAPNEIEVVQLMEELFTLADEYEYANLLRYFKGETLPPDSGLLIESKLKAGESVWSQMVAKAKSVVDFTVVGEQLYWGSPSIPVEDGPEITSIHFDNPPILDRDAGSVVTSVQVVGAGGILGVWPEVEVDNGYGKRTEFISDTNLNTMDEATARAREIYEANIAPSTFVVTGQNTLSPEFPIPLHEMIPGRNFLVTAEGQCLESSTDLVQLFNVVVEIRAEADPQKRLKEYRVAADFGAIGSEGKSERASG